MRRKTNIYLVVLCGAALTFASACSKTGQTATEISRQSPVSLLGVGHAAADAELLIGVIRDIHPGYIRYRSETDAGAAEQELRKAATDGQDVGSFYLAVSEFLAEFRCEHTEAELPATLSGWRDANPTMLPVNFTWVQGTAIVVGVAPGVSGMTTGDELLEVDGHSMRTLFEDMAKYISVDGFTEHTKATLFSGSDDIGLTTFDVFYPLLHGFRDFFC